jgi:hypothetical protein
MARRSVMKHSFARVPHADIPRSSFDRSCGYKTTFDAGYLIPVLVDEVIPGDTLSVRMHGFGRLATPIHPFMDNVFLDSFFFFVPNRLLWDNWERFNGAQDNPTDSVDFLIPTMTTVAGFAEGSLSDYYGIPTQVAGLEVNSLHHRAYNLIWNEWFRDENLQDSVVVDLDNGPDDESDYVLLRRGKRHDYFTSSLPWPQKGDAVPLPLTGDAPVVGLGAPDQVFAAGPVNVYETGGSATTSYANYKNIAGTSSPLSVYAEEDPNNSGYMNVRADLSAVTAATINELRQAFQIQKLYERDARGGTRYTEIVRSHFGVISPDARLQRPEYLGGGSSPVNVNPVAQTSSTDATTPQGNLAALGTVAVDGHGFTKSFTEHGVIIGLVSVRADLTYQQGLNRMWSRQTRWDFYWPALARIGEQAVLSKEIYADGSAGDEDVFGYQERFAEYRYKPSLVTGAMRSNAAAPLDTWHLSQDFGFRPVLNASFIEDNPPIDRVIAVPSEPHFLFDAYFSYKAVRPMPVYGVPGLIDHF